MASLLAALRGDRQALGGRLKLRRPWPVISASRARIASPGTNVSRAGYGLHIPIKLPTRATHQFRALDYHFIPKTSVKVP